MESTYLAYARPHLQLYECFTWTYLQKQPAIYDQTEWIYVISEIMATQSQQIMQCGNLRMNINAYYYV